jgi:hypothetical protein
MNREPRSATGIQLRTAVPPGCRIALSGKRATTSRESVPLYRRTAVPSYRRTRSCTFVQPYRRTAVLPS